MKRFVLMGVISSILMAACQELPEITEKESLISLNFAEPLKSIQTKVAEIPDTNAFILSIMSIAGDTLYYGKYGERPDIITVPSGTYELRVESVKFKEPAFDFPQYGDKKIVIASNGEKVSVSFLCKLLNSGVKMNISERFRQKYLNGLILLQQKDGNIYYSYTEDRVAYMSTGNVEFMCEQDLNKISLFNKVLGAGELLTINLDVSSSKSSSEFIMTVDTSVVRIYENIVVGEKFNGNDGSISEKALSISSAKDKIGEVLWVWGYVVGGDMTSSSISFTPPFKKTSHIAIAESASQKSRENCFSVELSKTEIKAALNLVDNVTLIGKKVLLYGVINGSYFGLVGMKNVSEYKIK